MIYLNPEVTSGLGEDTFWTWFMREFPGCSLQEPSMLKEDDVLLRYSTLGFLPVRGKQIAICWELYPEMRERFQSTQWDEKLSRVNETARYSTYRTVATPFSKQHYEQFGSVKVIPIGVDTEVFKPSDEKVDVLRKKYKLPLKKKIGVWIGTTHPMKGFGKLQQYARENPDVHWVIIWKWDLECNPMPNASNFVKIPQAQIAELLTAADFFLTASQLSTYYMAEWEAMACDIPFVNIGVPKEFTPGKSPRKDVFNHGWDRTSTKEVWTDYLTSIGVAW